MIIDLNRILRIVCLRVACVVMTTAGLASVCSADAGEEALDLGWYASYGYDGYHIPLIDSVSGNSTSKINVLLPHHGHQDPKAWLDGAAAAGMKVLVDLDGLTREAFQTGDYSKIEQIVATHKDHPALAGWYLIDEPLASNSHENVSTAYERVKAVDPDHNVHLTHTEDPTEWVAAGPYADILMIDKYPIYVPEYHVSRPWDVAKWSRLARSLRDESPTITEFQFVVQDFGSPVSPEYELWELPDDTELRYMSYAPVVEGASGIYWWRYEKTSEHHRDVVVPEISRELSSLIDGSHKIPDGVQVFTTHDADTTGHGIPDLTYRLVENTTGGYLIVVNNTDRAFTTTITVAGSRIESRFPESSLPVELMFADGPLEDARIIGSTQDPSGDKWYLTDSFSAFDVNVYRLYAVPEPSSVGLLWGGLTCALLFWKRSRR